MPNIGIPGLIIILIIALIVFGPKKLPQLGRAVGETLKEFKSSTKDIVDDVAEEFRIEDKETATKKISNTKSRLILIGGFLYVLIYVARSVYKNLYKSLLLIISLNNEEIKGPLGVCLMGENVEVDSMMDY